MKKAFVYILVCIGTGSLAFGEEKKVEKPQAGNPSTASEIQPLQVAPDGGRVEVRDHVANVDGSYLIHSNGSTGASGQLELSKPFMIRVGKKSDPEFHHGVLFNPGVRARIDQTIQPEQKNQRVQVEASVGSGYRIRGQNLHTSSEDRAKAREFVVEVGKLLIQEKDLERQIDRLGNSNISLEEVAKTDEWKNTPQNEREVKGQIILKRLNEEREEALERLNTELDELKKLVDSKIETAGFGQDLKKDREGYRDFCKYRPCTKIGTEEEINKLLEEVFDRFPQLNNEASLVAEVSAVNISYRYKDAKDLMARQNGVLLSPLSASAAVAGKFGPLNLKVCGAIEPISFLVGQSREFSRFESSVKGCVSSSVGQFATVKNEAGVLLGWTNDMDRLNYIFSNRASLEKLFKSPIGIHYTFEQESNNQGMNAQRHMIGARAEF